MKYVNIFSHKLKFRKLFQVNSISGTTFKISEKKMKELTSADNISIRKKLIKITFLG